MGLKDLFSKKLPKDRPLCGGVSDATDPSAPKTITSQQITQLYVHFCISERVTDKPYSRFTFEIKPDENGILTLSEKLSGISCKADNTLLERVQTIVRDCDLAGNNGVYRVTAGLPPEYQPCDVSISYDSGESIEYTVNNDPDALWAEKLYLLLAEWFSKNGNDSLLPPGENSQVTYLRARILKNGIRTGYFAVSIHNNDPQGISAVKLERTVSDETNNTILSKDYADFPDDYYLTITRIVDKYDLPVKYRISRFDHKKRSFSGHETGYYGMGERPDNEQDSPGLSVSLHLKYQSGTILNIDTAKPSEIQAMTPLLDELSEYLDSLF